MSVFALLLGIVGIAVLVFFFNYLMRVFMPGSEKFQQLVMAVGILCAIILILSAFGLWQAFTNITIPVR